MRFIDFLKIANSISGCDDYNVMCNDEYDITGISIDHDGKKIDIDGDYEWGLDYKILPLIKGRIPKS